MSLRDEVSKALGNFDVSTSQQIVSILEKIKETLQSDLTKEYLNSKLVAIKNSSSEDERKSLCSNLKPYFNWYLEKS